MKKIISTIIIGLVISLTACSEKPTVIENVNSEGITEIAEINKNEKILYDVPFTSQAPLANWADERQGEGCEEASTLIAMMWVNNYELTKAEAEQEIIKIADFETSNFGNHIHTSAEDTADRILKSYFNYDKYEIIKGFTKQELIDQLYEGKIIIIPSNGVKLANPYFTSPPEHHMLVIIGYDPDSKEFITNDPGTKRGANYRYGEDHLFEAIINYNSNGKNEVLEEKTAIIVNK